MRKNPKTLVTITQFHKTEKCSQSAISLDLIKRIFENAIEYRGVALGTRGMASTLGVITLGLMSWFAYTFLSTTNGNGVFMTVLDVLVSVAAFGFGIYFFLKTLRMELFSLEDEPVIFDRMSRKVYRIYREPIPGWKGLFKVWPDKFSEHSWDLIEAEHHAPVNANHANVSRIHRLIFQVRKSMSDSTIIDSFPIGSGAILGEVTVPAVWEHIRRFMEENGPHCPPGERVTNDPKAKSFLDTLKNTKNVFSSLWRNSKILVFMLIFWFPVTIPIGVLILVFSWLSYKTASPIGWPKEVSDAIGAPMKSMAFDKQENL